MQNTKDNTIVYFQCNNWIPSPKEASRFIYEYLEGEFGEKNVKKQVAKEIEWITNNKLCINTDVYDMSCQYWVTTTKEWLEENFPELLPFASETPKDDMFKGDRKYFLKYIPENFGEFFIGETILKEEFEKEKWRLIDNE